jgi:hypothetical protein
LELLQCFVLEEEEEEDERAAAFRNRSFPRSKPRTGYITDREVSKQWLEAKRLAGIPETVVLTVRVIASPPMRWRAPAA